MKNGLLSLLAIAFVISACSEKKINTIEGTWKQVHSQTYTGDSSVIYFPGKNEVDMTKIWSGNHWMFVARHKNDTTVTDSYGSGTFILEGNRYSENINILEYKEWEGKTIKMTLEMKNDTLIQTYPVDANGEMEKEWATVEKYVRIQK